MLPMIYWIVAIITMASICIGSIIHNIKVNKSDKKYKEILEKQEAIVDRQMRDIFRKDLQEIEQLLKSLKNESEEK